MRILFVGPPGAGKGTQCQRIAAQYEIPHISTGDLFRAEAKAGTPLGLEADRYMKIPALVPDEITIAMLRSRIAKEDARAGFLLDGFPRTIPQAEALESALKADNTGLDGVLLLQVPDDLIVERIVGRRTDPQTGIIYHLKFDPPPPEVAARVQQRADDTEEKCRKRLADYHAMTAPLIPFYEKAGLLRRVDGVGDPDDVTLRVNAALADKTPPPSP